jgi:hypothetical protein
MLCVYALTGARRLRPGTRGAAGERLRLVRAGAVAAIVGDVARAPRTTIRNLRDYDAALRRLHVERAALLPARFGTCFGAADELVLVLRERQRTVRDALSQVRQRTQMTLRVIAANHEGARSAARKTDLHQSHVNGRDAHAQLADAGSRYLRSRAAEAARDRDIPGFEAVRNAVKRWVRAERVEKQAGVVTVYHLVPRGSADVYRAAVERAAAESRLRMVVSGPWPPYAFATW